jgi:hypothetical protein
MPVTIRHAFSRRHFAALAGSGAALAGSRPLLARQATPSTPSATPDAGWQSVTEAAAAVAPLATLLASEIVGDALQPIAGLNPEQAQGVGSSFKLYILATIGAQVRDGLHDWGEPVTIEEQYRSVPGGDLRYVADGTQFTLRYIAERMIQKSDNTATDHAMGVVGRESVEEMFVTAGHATPERNVPLLRTREFAFMKFIYPDLDRYLAADVATRREILATEIPALSYDELLAVAAEQTAPQHIDTVEWFASATDLSTVMLFLRDMAASDFALQPLLEILSLETQIPLDGETWPYAGFKGGSEMGVLHGTWLLRRHDNRWFTLSIGFNDPEQALDMEAAVGVMAAAFAQLAATP